ncbi:hypothetical protein [Chryseobacterium indologenes]|uniref:hypothetical protein n=1 Tax=Chryseobacterium indologenes TaxID=253 RepID=UPI00076E36B7|nr:hypothetical protein [Chryseobacterium indologenes]
MIAPQELRIGNYFQESSSKEIIQVESISKDTVAFSGYFTKGWQAEPIELTEEWLFKLGYERDKNEYCVSGFDRFNVFQSVKGPYIFCDDEKSIRYVEYVHELQNIFFALTGEELTIKEQS